MWPLRLIVVLLFSILCLSGPAFAYGSEVQNSVVVVQPGQGARYIGSFPFEEYAWMQISVLNVEEDVVNVSLTYDVRSFFKMTDTWAWPDHPRYFPIHVASGRNNLFFFFVPANLTVGDAVPVPTGYPKMTVNGTDSYEYAGQTRKIIYASYVGMPWGGDGTFYWDQKTGLLVEIVAVVGKSYSSSLRLTETNLWSINWVDWIIANSALLSLIIVSVSVPTGLLILFAKKRLPRLYRVSHPLMGKIIMGTGVALLVFGILNLSLFNQLVTCLSFILALAFFVTGFLAYNGSWAYWSGNRFKIDFGAVLIAASIILFGTTVVCTMYREIGAMVPYFSDLPGRYTLTPQKHLLAVEGVFLYPWTWLVAPLVSVALSLVMFGVFCKVRIR